jgi:hypothetical protein
MLGLVTDLPVFLFFGMIRPYKGVIELLRVWNATPQLYGYASLVASRVEGLQVATSEVISETFEAKNLNALHRALERACGRTRAFRDELSKRPAAYKPQDSWVDIARLHAAIYGVEAADRRITLG